jgi:hypothetical protein
MQEAQIRGARSETSPGKKHEKLSEKLLKQKGLLFKKNFWWNWGLN